MSSLTPKTNLDVRKAADVPAKKPCVLVLR